MSTSTYLLSQVRVIGRNITGPANLLFLKNNIKSGITPFQVSISVQILSADLDQKTMDTSGTTAPEIVPILQDDRRLGVYLKKLEGIERQNERRLFSVYSPSGLEFQPRGSSLYSQSPRSHPISKQTAEEGTDGRLPPIRDILGMYLRSGDNLVSPDPYSDARHHSTSEQVCSRPAVCTSSGPNPFADALKCHEPGCMAGPLSTTYGLRYLWPISLCAFF